MRSSSQSGSARGRARNRRRGDATAALAARARFVAVVSHEMRTPLNAIVGMTDLLSATPDPAEAHELVATLQQSAQTLLHLVDDVLDFARIDHGTLTLAAVPFDLRRVAEDVLELFSLAGDDKRIALAAIVDPTLAAEVVGDAARLRQVLVNLVGNAVKFTDAGSVVLRITRGTDARNAPTVSFTVSDTGIGIPPALLPHVFEAFVQADAAATRRHSGTGLGLTLSQQIVAKMGGQLTASSVEGIGSSFSFTLPLTPTGPAADAPADGVLAGRRAIVVAPDPIVREALMAQLAALAIDAVALPAGEAALAWLREATTAPDALIVDGTEAAWLSAPPDRFASLPRLVLARRTGTLPAVPDARARTAFVPTPVRLGTLARQLTAILAPPPADDTGPKPEAGAAVPSAAWLERPRVLVAEDNAANRRFARLVLEGAGMAVDVVENGAEALAAVRSHGYDLVLMDWRMPVMDGLEATARIRREQGRIAHVPIVALTANTVLDAPDACLAAGMDAALLKPLRPRELIAAVTPWLGPRAPAAAQVAPQGVAPAAPDGPAPIPAARGSESPLDGAVIAELVAFAAEGALFVEMRDAFTDVVPRQRAALGAALDAGAAGRLLHAAHAIKGVAGQVGAREVQGLAAGIEELGRCDTVAGARALLAPLDAAIARAGRALAEVRPRGPEVAA